MKSIRNKRNSCQSQFGQIPVGINMGLFASHTALFCAFSPSAEYD